MAREAANQQPEVITYPDPPDFLSQKKFTLGTALKVFGPGAIIASITIGSGETFFASRGGAIYGYAIIWMFVVGALAKGALCYSANRYITVTGEHPMTRWAYLFPGPRGWFPLAMFVVSVISFPSWAGGLSVGIGSLVDLWTGGLFGASAWATVLLLAAATLAWVGGYAWLERAQTVIVAGMLLALLVAVIVVQPDYLAALGGLIPQVPEVPGWLAQKYPGIAARPIWVEIVVYTGAIGGGVYDYIGYTGMMREKQWGLLGHHDLARMVEGYAEAPKNTRLALSSDDAEVAKARAWSRAPMGDVLVSFAAMVFFGALFVIMGAEILHADQTVPAEDNVLTHQARFFTVISPALKYLYYLAIFSAFFGTLYGLWEVYSWTAYESLGAVSVRVRRAGQRVVRKYVYLYTLIGGLILAWTVGDLVIIVTPAAIFGGVLAGGLWCFGILWAEKVVLPPAYRIGKVGWWLTLFAGVLLTAFGVMAALGYFGLLPYEFV
ncbi:MAG: Nramp family divalent metal transporter [Actinobacteria bacterium]|nr:Nramp family divalent metal transporter [Actinomycetota bacterium]